MVSGESGVENGRRSWSDSRAGRLLSFVAITWSIAGGFVLLQEGLPTLVDAAVRKGWIPDSLVLTTPPASTSECGSAIQRARSSATDPRVTAQARLLVWRMGFQTGFAAGIASATSGSTAPVDSATLLAQPRQIAEALGVDAPTLPDIKHSANALREFQIFVAQDSRCVAAQVAVKYSPRDAALFKFGLIVGHAAVYRMKAPQLDPLFVPEVRVYGEQAEIPVELRQPFVDDSLDTLPGVSREQKVQFALSRLDEYFRTNR